MKEFFLLSVIVFLGCAPGLGPTLEVPHVQLGTGTIREFSDHNVKVRLGQFIDSRSSTAIAKVDGREVLPDGGIGAAVEEAFQGFLSEALVKMAVIDAPTIEGQVLDWGVNVLPGFPLTSVNGDARVAVTLRTSHNDVAYKGIYSSHATREHPTPGEGTVKDVLSEAMAGAVREALRDQDLRAKLVELQGR
jgi:hypothetical protein